jgi:hypothetical protein
MPHAFIHTNVTVLFSRNPTRPKPGLAMIGAEDQTAGGVRVGFDPLTGVETRLLPWSAMPDAELAALLAFKNTIVKGSSETFTWLSASGVAKTARLASGEITYTEIAHNANQVDVLVELV